MKKDKQLLYGPIDNLRSIALKTYQIYIKTNLVNSFIKLLKLPAGNFVFFV